MKTWSQPPTWLQPSAFRHIDVLKATPWSSDRASECGWTCRRFLKAADLLGFSTKEKTSLPFTEKHPIKKKERERWKMLLMPGVRRKGQTESSWWLGQGIQFSQAQQFWTIEDWKNVTWSDESRFLFCSDGRVRLQRGKHESRAEPTQVPVLIIRSKYTTAMIINWFE